MAIRYFFSFAVRLLLLRILLFSIREPFGRDGRSMRLLRGGGRGGRFAFGSSGGSFGDLLRSVIPV